MPYFGIPIRNGLPIGLGSVAGFGVAPAFSPSVLFAAGEQGAWYDPSDLTTLFQDAAGTTPTVMETRARLMLDKSKGLVLGPELVTNGDFSSGTTGWTVGASWVVSTGQAVTTSSSGYLIQSPFPAGDPILATYQVTVVCSGVSGTVFIGGGQYTSTTLQNGTRTLYLQRTGTSNNILYIGTGGGNATIISISIKAIAGNHATAPSDASSPILRARYNLLEYSEDFGNAYWNKTVAPVTISTNATVAPDGTTTADKVIATAANSAHRVFNNAGLQAVNNTNYTFSFYAKAAEQTWAYVDAYFGTNAFTWFDLTNGTVGTNAAGSTASITSVGNGWYFCKVVRNSAISGTNQLYIGIGGTPADNTVTFAGNGTDGIFIWGADLRTSSDAALNIPAYQSITTATSYDTAGFPPYLAFDGTDDSFSTASIDFTGTDKMTVFAGVTKLSDAAAGAVVELSSDINSNDGAFIVRAPTGASASYAFFSRGTTLQTADAASGYAAPITNVATGIGNIGAPAVTLRVNGTQVATNTVSQGTGNYGNYPLFIGRRNNTNLPFNGRIYSLIIRGAATTTPLIASTEQWVAGKMRLPI